jgi:hypothetical protein
MHHTTSVSAFSKQAHPTGSFENEYEYECENEQSWLLTTDYYSRDFINVPLSNVP